PKNTGKFLAECSRPTEPVSRNAETAGRTYMNRRLFAIFSVVAIASAALVAAAATGAFTGGDGATNAARPRAIPRPAGEGEDADEVRQKALDALKEARDNGTVPREDGQTPSDQAPGFLQGPDIPRDPTPAVVATSPDAQGTPGPTTGPAV